MMKNKEKSKENYKKLDNYIKYIKEEDEKLEELYIVKKAEEIFGCVSKDVQKHIAKKLEISKARVKGLIKYNSIKENPKGKYHISVCMGTTCKSKGACEILKELEVVLDIKKGESTQDGMFSLDTTGCIKYCVMAPIISINGKLYNQIKLEEVRKIIDCIKR